MILLAIEDDKAILVETEEEALNAIFLGHPPPDMKLEQIKHMFNAHIIHITSFHDLTNRKEHR